MTPARWDVVRRTAPFAALVLLTACGHETPEASSVESPAVPAVRVGAAVVEPVVEVVEAVGTVRSKTQTLIASKVQGYVREVRAREGDLVERQSLVIVVDDRELTARSERAQASLAEAEMAREELARTLAEAEAALRSAESDARYAEATATRYRQLFDKELVSAHDFEGTDARRKSAVAAVEQARARLLAVSARQQQVGKRIEQAKADVEIARIALADTHISAPETGVVVERRAEPGNLAVPGQTLLVLDDPRHYRLETQVAESVVARVRLGQPARIMVDALGRTLEGRVAEMIPAADPGSRSVTVKLDLPPQPDLLSGMFGRARLPEGERKALLVPVAALVQRGQLLGVYVVDARNVARLRLVTAGARIGTRVEILSGLDEDERLVIEGVERVADGSRVELVR